MEELTLIPANEIPYRRLSRVLNHAYADYYVTVWLDPFQFEQMCEDIDVDMDRSVVATVRGAPVGLALLSRRESEGWISGVGVLPAWRRQGIARAMLRHLLDTAHLAGLTRLRLEVLEQNIGAIALYEEMGFTCRRDLLSLTAAPTRTSTAVQTKGIASVQPAQVLRFFSAYHDVESSWQRDLPSISRRAQRIHGLALSVDEDIIAYLLYQPQQDLCMLLDLAVDPKHPNRADLAYYLLVTLQRTYPNLGAHVINVPAQDPLLPAYFEAGYETQLRQHEMERRTPLIS